MDEVFEKLRLLQDVLWEKVALERTIQEIPKQLGTQEELLARMKRTYIERNQEYDRARTADAEFRNLLAGAEASREKAEKNMEVISTQREYEALDREIRDAAEKEQQYRKELQKQERLLADLTEQIKASEDLIESQEKDLTERRRGVEAEVAEKRARAVELAAREKELAEGLDSEVYFKFDRIIRNKMGQGIVAIRSGVCTGCHMILPAQFANNVRMGQEIVFCPYCSRILYYEDAEQGAEDFFDDGDSGSLADLEDLDDEDEEEEEERTADFEEQ